MKRLNVLLIIAIVFGLVVKLHNFDLEKKDLPTISQKATDDVLLILVNKNNMISNNYKVNLSTFRGYKVATVMVRELDNMYKAASKVGVSLEINAAYRSEIEQKTIFNKSVADYQKQGNSYNVALEKTKRLVASPGYSEHETGLAIDFSANGNYDKKREVWEWLESNAYQYGFILRYPEGKEYITGYDYEPWHYRYVGRKYAKIIYESNLTLEEYLKVE